MERKEKIKLALKIIFIILIIILILVFTAVIFKTIYDMYNYNKCFISDYDPNYNYDICVNYLDY